METLRDELLDIIAGPLPDTPEVMEFCEENFGDMLDKVMDKIKEYLVAAVEAMTDWR